MEGVVEMAVIYKCNYAGLLLAETKEFAMGGYNRKWYRYRINIWEGCVKIFMKDI